MKLVPIFTILVLSHSLSFCTSGDKVVDAISASDPEMLRDLIIPGFLIRLEDKKRYVSLAQEITNTTHAQMHKFRASDIFNTVKGFSYLGLSTVFAYMGFDYWASNRSWSRLFSLGNIKLAVQTQRAARAERAARAGTDVDADEEINLVNEKIVVPILGALGVYFAGKGLGTFHAILTKQKSVDIHNNALTVEAIIQRLPAFDNGCFVPGSLQEKEA